MYHYLKWAALSLFFKRNVRYLALIALSLVGIYTLNAIYEDLVAYLIATQRQDDILTLLVFKWLLIFALVGLLLFSVFRLGFSKENKAVRTREKTSKLRPQKKDTVSSHSSTDPILERLDKFKEPKRLKRKSDRFLEQLKGKKD